MATDSQPKSCKNIEVSSDDMAPDLPKAYDKCKHIKRVVPEYEMNEELSKEIARDFRTFPCFEKMLYEHLYMKHYSLERNELLKCRWKEYREHISERVFSPFKFPSNRDEHFHNGLVKFIPSESIHQITSFRMRLKPGPGVDNRGQIPIPNELQLKRGIAEKEDTKKGQKEVKIKKNEVKIMKNVEKSSKSPKPESCKVVAVVPLVCKEKCDCR